MAPWLGRSIYAAAARAAAVRFLCRYLSGIESDLGLVYQFSVGHGETGRRISYTFNVARIRKEKIIFIAAVVFPLISRIRESYQTYNTINKLNNELGYGQASDISTFAM